MEYESIYVELGELAEQLKAQLNTQQKLLKRIEKFMSFGDLKNACKDVESILPASKESLKTIESLKEYTHSIDVENYLESGDFAAQLVAECESRGVNIVGEDRSYEIFPYRLKVNPQDEEVLINGKKAPGVRPSAVADVLEKGRSKLLSANFNADKFAAELAAAYDLVILSGANGKKSTSDSDVYLNTLYKYLTPMGRFRRDYDAQSYAFDIARLYSTEDLSLADGRKLQFGPSRNNNRAIRILDIYGNELFIATIRFYLP